jgi:hypothetical protein
LTILTGPASATKYAGEPYALGAGGRALGRAGAFTAASPDASSAYWNIAALTRLERNEFLVQHAETFGSLLNHEFVAVGVAPRQADGWAWGGYLSYLGGSGIQLTVLDSTTGRPRVVAEASHANWSIVAGAARQTRGWGAWGIAAKAVINDLPGNRAYGLGADLAWWSQWRRVRLGAKLSDLTGTFLSYDSGRRETIVPHLNAGAELDLPKLATGVGLTLAAEAETYFEGRRRAAQFWSGSVSADLHLGLEVQYRERLYGRIGSDAGALALGAGFVAGRWGVDGALGDHAFLDSSYRISVRLRWP